MIEHEARAREIANGRLPAWLISRLTPYDPPEGIPEEQYRAVRLCVISAMHGPEIAAEIARMEARET